jgi:hypothetical protein
MIDNALGAPWKLAPPPPQTRFIMPKIIGITGLAGSGKSTIADILEYDFGFVRVKMAGPLKAMLRAIGMSDVHIEGELKHSEQPMLCGKTPRHAMQTLGTEWGRKCIGENFWTGLFTEAACDVIDNVGKVVCDDVRFANEADTIRRIGGMIWGVTRPGVASGKHESETGIAEIEPDHVIVNGGTIEDLQDAVWGLVLR